MHYVDLSIPIVNGTPSFPGEPGGFIIPFASLEMQGYVSHQLLLYSHLGTHIDAPSHFIKQGKGITDWELEQLIGSAMIVKLTQTIHGGEELQYQDFSWTREPRAGDRIILHTGWDKYWNQPEYFGNFPVLGVELIEYLVECGIALLAMDTPTPHTSQSEKVHHLLLNNGIVIVEGITNVDLIPVKEGQIIYLPLPLQGVDGAPARVVFGY